MKLVMGILTACSGIGNDKVRDMDHVRELFKLGFKGLEEKYVSYKFSAGASRQQGRLSQCSMSSWAQWLKPASIKLNGNEKDRKNLAARIRKQPKISAVEQSELEHLEQGQPPPKRARTSAPTAVEEPPSS